MSSVIEAKILTLTQATSTFAASSVTLGNYKILDKSGAAPFCIILPGPFTAEANGGWGMVRIAWTYYADIICKFLRDDYTQLKTAREAFVNNINTYPTLDGLSGVVHCLATGGDEIDYLYAAGDTDNPQYVMQKITIEIQENKNYTGGEFA